MKKIDYTLVDGQNYKLEFVGGYENSTCIDVALAEDVELRYGESYLASLGFAMKIPEGYKAIMKPRSSTFKKYGVIQTNHLSEIDTNYLSLADVWRIPLFRPLDMVAIQYIVENKKEMLIDDVLIIPKGTRIAQMEIVKRMEKVDFNLMSNEDYSKEYNKTRGGFGSTGVM